MPFNIALSGLNAASADLDVTANNIANANTTGFKESRAEFVDVYAVANQGISATSTGSGARLAQLSQQFTQGNVDFTQNNLDLAINGQGFFVLADDGGTVYSRAGSFQTDREGYVVNGQDQRLQVFPPAGDGSFNTGSLEDLQLATTEGTPQATSVIELGANLPADAVPPPVAFDPAEPASYNHSTATTVFDSLGAEHTAQIYFVRDAAATSWQAYLYTDGTAVGTAQPVVFDPDGTLNTPTDGQLLFGNFTPTNGADPLPLQVDVLQTTQYGGDFSVNRLFQDGYASGRLTGIDINPEGVALARYTNGQAIPLGKVALANFANPQGLQQLGDTTWTETFSSGNALNGEAGTSSLGLIQSGALEASNVDLTDQLVNMITAQRNFQANAQMISTADTITQTIINIR
ncbi:MAG: flagellar hook protein FlgE [Pseudomonadota bacterium]|nr:flagellar hook protein FlgE [Pseudomonadota bacterium]HJO35840.1 flagellar hook protein FlgE [Gammaproteobacteria bacterium]